MSASKLVALGVLALGAAYVLGYDPFGIFQALQQTLTPAEQRIRAALTGVQASVTQAQAPERSGGAGAAGAIGAATSAVGIAAGAGVAGMALALTAGIAGGAAILVWGIVRRGWFRGGEEGILVNPARDELMDVSATIPFAAVEVAGLRTWPPIRSLNRDGRTVADLEGSGVPRSEWSQLRYESMLKAFAAAQVPAAETESVIGQLYAADNMTEFEAAAYRYLGALQGGAQAQGIAV